MFSPATPAFHRQTAGRDWARRPGVRTYASVLLARAAAMLLAACCWLATLTTVGADMPRVQFDTGYTVPCRDVTPEDLDSVRSGERRVEARFRISALVLEGALPDAAQYMYQIISPLGSMQIVDYEPRTALATDVVGNVSIDKKKESSKSLGISLSGSFDQLVKGTGGADLGAKDTSQVRYELKPQMEVLLASGTLNRGTGAYFKLRPSADTSLEGDRTFTITFRVPADWRGDIVYLKCEAQEQRRGQLISRGAAHFMIALHAAGDDEVRQAAEELIHAESLLRQTVAKREDDIQRCALPTVAHRVGALLDLYDPRIPEQWLDRLIYGPANLRRHAFVQHLPEDIRVLASQYVQAKRRMFFFSGKQLALLGRVDS